MIRRLATFGFTIAAVFSFILASPVHAAAPLFTTKLPWYARLVSWPPRP